MKSIKRPLKRSFQQASTALIIIDVQKRFCDPSIPDGWPADTEMRGTIDTSLISEKIAGAVPFFRQAGLPIYAIYYNYDRLIPHKKLDFYKYIPASDDHIIVKNSDSAFQSSNLHNILLGKGCRNLLVCGFNFNGCVAATAFDAALNDFKVGVLGDLSGNGRYNMTHDNNANVLKEMDLRGIRITRSDFELKY